MSTGPSSLSDFAHITNDSEWTHQFLMMEEVHWKNPGGGFKDQMEVQLRPSDFHIVRWLAEKPSGRNIERDIQHRDHYDIFQHLKSALQREYPDDNVTDEIAREKIQHTITQDYQAIIWDSFRHESLLTQTIRSSGGSGISLLGFNLRCLNLLILYVKNYCAKGSSKEAG